jgi:hypothetical protein
MHTFHHAPSQLLALPSMSINAFAFTFDQQEGSDDGRKSLKI